MNQDAIKFAGWIIFGLISLATVVISVNAYFAKTIQVEAVEDRLDLKIVDDRVFQQEQQIQQMRNYTVFQRQESEPEFTPMEIETLKKAEERLYDLKAEKNRKEQAYQKRRK